MAKVRKSLSLIMACVIVIGMALFVSSCKKTEDTVGPGISTVVPDSLFPLIAGRVINFNGYLSQNDTETKITASETGYFTRWTLSGTLPLTAVLGGLGTGLGNGFFIKDSTYIAGTDTLRNPKVLPGSKITPLFIRYDSVTAKYSYLTNLGYFYRTFQIKLPGVTTIRSDSLRWITLADPRSGIGTSFKALPDENFSGTVSGTAATITLVINGVFEAQETLNIGGTNYDTYRLAASRVVTLGSTQIATGTTAKVWLQPGKGIVKIYLYGDAESHGRFFTMTTRTY